MHTPKLTGELEPWHHDTLIVRGRNQTVNVDAFVTFALMRDEVIAQVKIEAISSLANYSFDFQDMQLKLEPASKS